MNVLTNSSSHFENYLYYFLLPFWKLCTLLELLHLRLLLAIFWLAILVLFYFALRTLENFIFKEHLRLECIWLRLELYTTFWFNLKYCGFWFSGIGLSIKLHYSNINSFSFQFIKHRIDKKQIWKLLYKFV